MFLLYLSSGYNKSMKFRKYLLTVFVGLLMLWLAPVQAQVYPGFAPERRVTDVSGTLSAEYLSQIEQKINKYPFEVRVVYVPDTTHLNLGSYAASLFKRWKLSEESMLLVVALDRPKMGVHAGKDLKSSLSENIQDQELPVPSVEALSGVNPDPTLPVEIAPELSYMDLIPNAIDQVTESLKESAQDNRALPSSEPGTEESHFQVQQEYERPRKTFALSSREWLGLIGLGLGLLLGMGGWFGLRFWRRWRKHQALIERYSMQGQVVYGALEQVYESLETVMPDFHGYLGETERTLGLFLKSIHHLQEEYEDIFDAFNEEIELLGQKDTREEAVTFFQDLELKLEEGKQLHEQALNVLKNLKDVGQSNQQMFSQTTQRRQRYLQELKELRKLHPLLKLDRIQQIYQQALQELQRMEKTNDRDPLGVEKSLKNWRKKISKLEQETRSLPHLLQQFQQDLKERILELRKRIQDHGTPLQTKNLQEIEKLHRTLVLAIQQGDLTQLDRWNERFTHKLQDLEAEI